MRNAKRAVEIPSCSDLGTLSLTTWRTGSPRTILSFSTESAASATRRISPGPARTSWGGFEAVAYRITVLLSAEADLSSKRLLIL